MNSRLVLCCFLAVVLAACGTAEVEDQGSSPSPTSPQTPTPTATAATFPVTITADNGEVELAEQPSRIVSLSPTATEILFAIGAGDQVVAADEHSNYPEQAPTTKLSGFQPNLEAILEYEPDLVVASSDPGELVAGLDSAGVPTMIHGSAASFDDAYSQIEQLGAATGHVGGAAEVVATMQSDIEDIVSSLPERTEPLSYYHELDPSYYSVSSGTFIGEVYSRLGLESIADAAAEQAGPYPQLSAEYILEADPDLIFLADTKCCDVSAESVAQRPGWESMTAVENDAIVELDDDVASRWGPRIVELMRTVAERVEQVASATAEPTTSAS